MPPVTVAWSARCTAGATACGTPVISDTWPGLETFFTPGKEILLSRDSRDTLAYLHDYDEAARRRLAEAARQRVCGAHTAEHRAIELEGYTRAAAGRSERWKATPHG